MNPSTKPQLPKSCPVCSVAMQAHKTEAGTVHRCERCGLTVAIAPPKTSER